MLSTEAPHLKRLRVRSRAEYMERLRSHVTANVAVDTAADARRLFESWVQATNTVADPGFWKGVETFANQINDAIQGRLQGSATVNKTDDDSVPVPPRWMTQRDDEK